MKKISVCILALFLFSACSGADSVVKKGWRNTETTIVLKDITAKDFNLMDAGARLQTALEEKLAKSTYSLSGENARYALKFKILNFDEGSRALRIATFGLADSAKSKLSVKVGLFREGDLVGAWTVDSWVKGGPTGGSNEELFGKAAEEIMQHLKGDH